MVGNDNNQVEENHRVNNRDREAEGSSISDRIPPLDLRAERRYCLTSPADIKEIMRMCGFSFSKSLGQNFLIDSHIVEKIVDAAQVEGRLVIEIGPGFGVLTEALCQKAAKVIAIEKDKKIPPILRTLVPADNLDIIEGDALQVNLDELVVQAGYEHAIVVANLPYYITTPIVMGVLEQSRRIEALVVMMQKEVADRILDEGDRGAITIAASYYADSVRVTDVSKNSFMPAPKVGSSVIRMDRHETFLSGREEEVFFKVLKAIYSTRRKTLLNSLSSLKNISKNNLKCAIIEGGIVVSVRGETLTVAELAELSKSIARWEDKLE